MFEQLGPEACVVLDLQLTTLRGSVLEEAIPSTSRHGSARALPAKDILEHVCPELQLSALRMAQPGIKVITIIFGGFFKLY